jgi:hypothetical protein
LAKAEERVARRNLELFEGISSFAPLFSVNRDLALNCLQQLGINLGGSSVEKDKNPLDLLDVGVGEGVGGWSAMRMGKVLRVRLRVWTILGGML